MSIHVENNLKDSINDDIFKQKAHYIPCKIDEDGQANVKKYFEPYIVENTNGELSATFRGHSLDGVKLSLPEGYRAVLVTETKRPLSEDVERKFQILLESIFGSDTDVRNNIFDVNKLLRYLRKSVDLHKNHADGSVVTLTSKRCLTLSLPGCFCKPGFVESSGQCVLPSDCVTSDYKQYLTRIIVL
ncbi:uncharacterized protein LOC116778327 isoform X2 [Danaus plexippus]|uniref:uncharacterized protein LOC116778327 isoform X2 n=1 Tax=Danaus plexippus TaxID=13037 RepID=UPI002AB2E3B9|nr:uncharacterized protein LOC116778327 isoform X2 [Danaus plexippus]